MIERHDASRRVERPGGTAQDNPQDPQIDPETGLPVAIVPDGEKVETGPGLPQKERLKVDPDSRIPRPVQPDLA